jgi:lipopolysaccharide export system permease protein
MRTLDRYIAAIFLKNFAIAVFALCTLFLFQAIMGDILDHSFTSEQVIYYHLLNVPQVFVQMSAPAVLLGTVLTLSGLSRSQELVACYSIGVGLPRLMFLLLSLVFMISCVVLIAQDRIVPPSFKKRQAFYWREMKKRPDFFVDIKKDKIWYRSRNLIYNLQRFDPAEQRIYGMSVYTFDESFNLVQVMDAGRADFEPEGWRLQDGTVTVFSKEDPFPLNKNFREKELIINETPRDFMEIEKEVEGLRLKELYRYINKIAEAGADVKGYWVKFHSRISLSFIPLVMCALGVPFSVRRTREGGIGRDLGLCLVATFFYWLFYAIGLSLGTNGVLPPFLAAWLPSVAFGAATAALIYRK